MAHTKGPSHGGGGRCRAWVGARDVTKFIFVLALFSAVAGAVLAGAQIGAVFEEKSRYSYLLKSGDGEPTSAAAHAHAKGVSAYGYWVAIELAFCSVVAGLLLGVWWQRRRGASCR